MKKRILATAVLGAMLATTDLAFAVCDSLEYAELKDMSTKNLVQEFCHAQALARIDREEAHQATELIALGASPAQANAALARAGFCSEQLSKLIRVLKTRRAPLPPACP